MTPSLDKTTAGFFRTFFWTFSGTADLLTERHVSFFFKKYCENPLGVFKISFSLSCKLVHEKFQKKFKLFKDPPIFSFYSLFGMRPKIYHI